MKFRRSLSERTFNKFLSDKRYQGFLSAVAENPELSVDLREDHVDVYYAGFVVFRLYGSGRLQIGSLSDRTSKDEEIKKWSLNTPRLIEKLDLKHIQTYASNVKRYRKRRKRPSKELAFELLIVRGNRVPGSKVFPLDRQIVKPGGGLNRLDLLMYDVEVERLVLTELKLATNQELRKEVFGQMERYRVMFETSPDIVADYREVFSQKRKLGLITHDVEAIRINEPPDLLLLIAGYGDLPHKEASIVKSAAKSAAGASYRIHVRDWEGFPDDPSDYRFDKGVTHYPRFEEWAEDKLLALT